MMIRHGSIKEDCVQLLTINRGGGQRYLYLRVFVAEGMGSLIARRKIGMRLYAGTARVRVYQRD